MGSGFSKMKKQKKQFAEQMTQLQAELENTEFMGTAGNGLVTLILNGQKDLKSIKIQSDCVDPNDVEGLEDLIQAAFQDAVQKLEKASPMNSLPGMF